MHTKPVPIKIESGGVSLEKDVFWATIGFMVGKKVAGLPGGVVGALTQGNSEILNYRVWFSDGSYTDRQLAKNQAMIDLIVWHWRIANKKAESDYVTLGVDFSALSWGDYVSLDCLNQYIGIPSPSKKQQTIGYSSENKGEFKQAFSELKDVMGNFNQALSLELGLKKIIKQELTRYIKDKEGLDVNIWEEKTGFRIPKKHRRKADQPLGKIEIAMFLIFLFGFFSFIGFEVAKSNRDSPTYQPSK
jgi:hypothetical protein